MTSMHPTVEEKNEDPWCGNVENKNCFEMDHMCSNIAAAQTQFSNVTKCEFSGLGHNSCVEVSGDMAKSLNFGQRDSWNSHSLTIQSHDLDLPPNNQNKWFAQGDSQRSNYLEKDTKQGNSGTKDEISEFDFIVDNVECGGIRLQEKFTTGKK